MTVKVYHCGVIGDQYPTLVAMIDTDNLETAYHKTQNFMGSWSQDKFLANGEVNEDCCELIRVLAKLPTHRGKTYGLRSTMVGDILDLNGVRYEVMPIGFRLVKVSA